MRSERWDPRKHVCVADCVIELGKKHAKGCKLRPFRRDPKQWSHFFSIECAAGLNAETRARLVRCVPTEGVAVPYQKYNEEG